MRVVEPPAPHPLSQNARDLSVLIIVAAVLRLSFYSGLIGGDDFAYAHLAREILDTGYPAVGFNVFAGRPLFITPIAVNVGVFGWSEYAITAPVLVASLCGITCVYCIGTTLSGRVCGLAASLTLTVYPLDLVYATTLTPDIVGSTIWAIAALATTFSFSAGIRARNKRATAFGLLGGVAASLAPTVKSSLALGVIPFLLIVGSVAMAHRQSWVTVRAIFGGLLAGQLAVMLFFYVTSGDPLANYFTELGFNRAFMREPYLNTRFAALLSYPSWMFGVRPAFPDNDRFFPYGLFFFMVAAAMLTTLRLANHRAQIVAAWFFGWFLLLQFWPLQVLPSYVPVHRLPRFLHLCAVPGSLMIGLAVAHGWSRGQLVRTVWIGPWFVYATHALSSTAVAVERHQDAMQDLRFAAAVSSGFTGPIVTDAELRGYLIVRRGFRNVDNIQKTLGAQTIVAPRSMVIFGGSRRIDMDPDWAERRIPRRLPEDWIQLARLPGAPRPWRRSQGSVYISVSDANLHGAGFTETEGSSTCGPNHHWMLVDVLDVGAARSERDHAYRIDGQTFAGSRTMFSHQGAELEDDGRAFNRSQSFEISGLRMDTPTCLVKRTDPSARQQVSRWLVEGREAAVMVTREGPVGHWLALSVGVSSQLISGASLRFTEEFSSGDPDINGYRVEVYQADSKDSSVPRATHSRP